jgi:hypothetical protein
MALTHLLDTSVHRQDARSDCGDAQCAAFLADSAVAGRRLVGEDITAQTGVAPDAATMNLPAREPILIRAAR